MNSLKKHFESIWICGFQNTTHIDIAYLYYIC